MRTDRAAALISVVVLTSAGIACGQRAAGKAVDNDRSQAQADTVAGVATCPPLETRPPNAGKSVV